MRFGRGEQLRRGSTLSPERPSLGRLNPATITTAIPTPRLHRDLPRRFSMGTRVLGQRRGGRAGERRRQTAAGRPLGRPLRRAGPEGARPRLGSEAAPRAPGEPDPRTPARRGDGAGAVQPRPPR